MLKEKSLSISRLRSAISVSEDIESIVPYPPGFTALNSHRSKSAPTSACFEKWMAR